MKCEYLCKEYSMSRKYPNTPLIVFLKITANQYFGKWGFFFTVICTRIQIKLLQLQIYIEYIL